MLADLMEDSKHGNVSLAGASRSTYKKIFIGVVGRLIHQGLYPVQTLHPFEHKLADLGKQRMNKG